jgi:hypothetical protein
VPRSKQCGFIFLTGQEKDAAQLVRTMAHELGNGAFTLEHTFADYTALAQGSTDNLMDYGTGTTLWKYQWDRIHSPRIVLGVFESDEAGASYNCPYRWFSSSGECESVGRALELIKSQSTVSKKITVSSPTSSDHSELTAEDITIDDTKYKAIRILNRVEKDKSITFDPRYYEEVDGDFLTESGKTERQTGFAYYVDKTMRVKILVEPDSMRKFLKVYLFGASFTEVQDFMKGVADNSATPVQIRNIRKFIRNLNDTTAQKGFYLELQKKVQYHNQTDNNQTAYVADRMCNLTSLAACLEMLGVSNPDPSMQFEDYLEKQREDKDYDARTSSSSWSALLKDLGVQNYPIDLGSSDKDFLIKKLLPPLEKGYGVMLGVSKNAGHLVRLQGISDVGLIVDDPYGKLTDFAAREAGTGNDYDKNDRTTGSVKGNDNIWSWDNLKQISLLFAYVSKQ